MRAILVSGFIAAAMMAGTTAAHADGHCATSEQASQVREFYANPGPLPVMAAGRALQMSEIQIVSGLSTDMAVGTTGESFDEVWKNLVTWDKAVLLIVKGGNVFEIHSTVPTGQPSTRSSFFNLDDGLPFRGHLRADLVTSIYALEMSGEEGRIPRGVFFYNSSGESTFGVILGGPGFVASEADIAKFEALKDVIRSLPGACPNS